MIDAQLYYSIVFLPLIYIPLLLFQYMNIWGIKRYITLLRSRSTLYA